MTDDQMSLIMNLLYEHKAPALAPAALADVLDRMIWCLDDEGAALLRIRERWLDSDDHGRVEVALAMNETFPFKDSIAMDAVLDRISSRWPDLATRCGEIRAARLRS